MPLLEVEYFNPVVPDWTPECAAEELLQRESCDVCLYVITPEMTGVYSIAEMVDDSNKRPEKTVFAVLNPDETIGSFTYMAKTFTPPQLKSLEATSKLVAANGATSLGILYQGLHGVENLAAYLNMRGAGDVA
jgi:hypothetical protein